MNISSITYNSCQNKNYLNEKKVQKFQKQSKSLIFTSNVNFSSPIQVVSKKTKSALNIYMNKILASIIETNDNALKNYFTPVFKNLILKSKTENDFYKNLSDIVSKFISSSDFIKSNDRKICYAERTMKMLEGHKLPQNTVYVDIGCGNGVVTKSISENLNIGQKNTYGLEVFEPGKIDGLNVIKYDGNNIPKFVPNSDFVTLYTVLHHMKNEGQANNLLKSLYAKMNNKGYLLIREHEVNNEQDEAFWKIVHDINTKIMKRTSSDLNNGTLYKSSNDWETILRDVGFKIIKKWHDLSYNEQKSYFLLVQK